MQRLEEVMTIVADVLGLGIRKKFLSAESPLLGAIPEFDSMAVVHLVASLEENFGLVIHDDEISSRTFETVGTLTKFIEEKLA